jgi:uncharacterized protein YjiS (DUF1127 family)
MGQATTVAGARAGHGPIANRVLGMARRVWSAYWAWRAERATVAILHGLDDWALKDIGIDRSEIESVVYGARQERRVGLCL